MVGAVSGPASTESRTEHGATPLHQLELDRRPGVPSTDASMAGRADRMDVEPAGLRGHDRSSAGPTGPVSSGPVRSAGGLGPEARITGGTGDSRRRSDGRTAAGSGRRRRRPRPAPADRCTRRRKRGAAGGTYPGRPGRSAAAAAANRWDVDGGLRHPQTVDPGDRPWASGHCPCSRRPAASDPPRRWRLGSDPQGLGRLAVPRAAARV